MTYRIIQLHLPLSNKPAFADLLKDPLILDAWLLEECNKRLIYSLLVHTHEVQPVSDKLQTFLGIGDKDHMIGVEDDDELRIIIKPVETVFPKPKPKETGISGGKKLFAGVISREELYDDLSKGAQVDRTFILLVIFSTIVASIGLLEDNVAVIIGAMVIAPLLSPNLALALGTALGDKKLMLDALKTNAVGFAIVFAFATVLGMIWPAGHLLETNELLTRTHVGLDGVLLAIVSGGAGVLSLTTGVSSVLVGVMVAVALLPPATTFGLMLGSGHLVEAMGAGLLLAVNIVCVNLAAKLVFWMQGVAPRQWYEKQKAQKAMKWYLLVWGIALVLLIALMQLHKYIQP